MEETEEEYQPSPEKQKVLVGWSDRTVKDLVELTQYMLDRGDKKRKPFHRELVWEAARRKSLAPVQTPRTTVRTGPVELVPDGKLSQVSMF